MSRYISSLLVIGVAVILLVGALATGDRDLAILSGLISVVGIAVAATTRWPNIPENPL